jgi:hypothetical protein
MSLKFVIFHESESAHLANPPSCVKPHFVDFLTSSCPELAIIAMRASELGFLVNSSEMMLEIMSSSESLRTMWASKDPLVPVSSQMVPQNHLVACNVVEHFRTFGTGDSPPSFLLLECKVSIEKMLLHVLHEIWSVLASLNGAGEGADSRVDKLKVSWYAGGARRELFIANPADKVFGIQADRWTRFFEICMGDGLPRGGFLLRYY